MSKRLKIFLLLSCLCLLAYANSLQGVFVSDDLAAIVENPQISQLSGLWLNPQGLLNSLSYRLAGFNPLPYHLASVLLHSLNTILVFLFLSLFFKSTPSLLGACIFAVHPIHTEAVSWVSGRPYLILTFFMLMAYLLYYHALNQEGTSKRGRLLCYIFSLVIFSYLIFTIFGFSVFFPFLLILSDLTLHKGKKNWRYWVPFIIIFSLRLILAQGEISQRISFMAEERIFPVTNPFLCPFISLYGHLWFLLWPARLALDHNLLIPAVLARHSLFFLFPVPLLLAILFKKVRLLFFALGIFIFFLIPTYSPIPLSNPIAERYLYFPCLSLSMTIAFFYERYASKQHRLKKIFLCLFIVLTLAYTTRIIIRNQDWRTPVTFWENTLKAFPDNAQAYLERGIIYVHEGDNKKAIEYWNKAIQIAPEYFKAYYNRGIAYQDQGNLHQALLDYTQAIQLNPKYADAYNNRGAVYYAQGNFEQALSDYNRAIKINPKYFKAYNNRGAFYQVQGQLTQALSDYNKAIQLRPDLAAAYNNRAMVYYLQGAYVKAEEDITKAKALGYAVSSKFLEALKSAQGGR